MAKWFETKVRYERTNEDGKVGKVTEAYMVDALTFSEAEKRSLEELAAYTTGELEVVAAKITNIAEVVAGYKDELFDGDKWYNCKLEYITLDERTQKEKKTPHVMLILAGDIDAAKKNLQKAMQGTMMDYSVKSITETKVMDVFTYMSAAITEQANNNQQNQ